jgi:hypothetical protein
MARMQVEIERQAFDKKRSSVYDFVCISNKYIIAFIFICQVGINTNVNKPLSIEILEELNIGQLQVFVNDLHCQIEGN